jgi:hypothetical protein
MGDLAADRDSEDKHSRRRSTPLALRLLTRPSPDRGSVRIISIQYFNKRGSHNSLEKGERETKRESVVGGGAQSQEQMYNVFACGHSSPGRGMDECASRLPPPATCISCVQLWKREVWRGAPPPSLTPTPLFDS